MPRAVVRGGEVGEVAVGEVLREGNRAEGTLVEEGGWSEFCALAVGVDGGELLSAVPVLVLDFGLSEVGAGVGGDFGEALVFVLRALADVGFDVQAKVAVGSEYSRRVDFLHQVLVHRLALDNLLNVMVPALHNL